MAALSRAADSVALTTLTDGGIARTVGVYAFWTAFQG
jgi:hypothetical protein